MINVKKVLLLLTFFTIFLASGAAAAAGPVILPTNHYMAANLKMITEETSATDSTVGKISGPMGVPILFRTFDQVTCNAGRYEILMRIIKTDTNQLIASSNPIPVTAPYDGYVHAQPAVWQVLFPVVGWYRFEVVANGTPIAYYFFLVVFNV